MAGRTYQSPIERFNNSYTPVPECGCWLWTGGLNKHGYASLMVNGKSIYAHRFSYSHHFGEIGEFHVCHKCDTPSCVNPNHLFLGTNKDNSGDRDRKGRTLKGQSHPKAKLSDLDVKNILSDKRKYKEIAIHWGVSIWHIKDIKRGVARNE